MINIKKASPKDAETVHQLLKALASDLDKENDYNGSKERLLDYGFKENSFFEAFFKIMLITPVAAPVPYRTEEAPFKTSILSI